MYRYILSFLAVFFIFGFFSAPVFAVTVGIVNAPASIGQDAFTLTASVSGAQAGTNYLRVDIYKDGTTNYFGETFSGSSWVSGSDGTTYFPIVLQANTPWVGTVQGRIGNPSATDYDGTGNYKLRLRRYTASGNPGSNDTMDTVGVTVFFPTPTVPPTNTPTPIHTPTPIKTLTLTLSQKIPTATSTVKVTLSPANNQNAIDNSIEGANGSDSGDFAFATTLTNAPLPTTAVLGIETEKSSFPWIPLICISIGLLIFGSCGILMYLHYRKYGTFFSSS